MTELSIQVAALAALFWLASISSAQVPPDDGTTELQPTYDHVVDDVEIAWPVATRTTDPNVVSLYTGERVINVWSLVAYYWPEICGVLLVAIGLFCLRRLSRTRGIVGEPHCRKCWYALVDFEGSKCPECGAELTAENRVIAHSRRIPITICIVLLVAVVGAYVVGRTRLPREGELKNGNGLHSSWLAQFADSYQNKWLLRHLVTDYAFLQIDVRTGAIVSTIPTGVGEWVFAAPRPDGDFVLELQKNSIRAIELGTGARLAELTVDPTREQLVGSHMASIWGIVPTADPDIAYATTQLGNLMRFDLSKRTVETLPFSSQPPIFDFFARDDGRNLVFVKNDPQDGWFVQEYDPRTHRMPRTIVSPTRSAIRSVLMTPDSRWLAMTDDGAPNDVQLWDYEKGKQVCTSSAPIGPIRVAAMSADGRWIVASAISPNAPTRAPDTYFVFDTRTTNRVGKLAWPCTSIRNVCILADNHTVVAFGADGQRRVHVFGWDLARLTTD